MPKPDKNWSPAEIALIKDCLVQMLDSDLFSQTERQSRFLQYIVEKTIAGEGSKIKQFAIGIDVFDHNESFDPAIDSIVRVEAGRLRSKLREYYSNPDCNDEVEIEMRKSKYIVDFNFKLLDKPNNSLSRGKENENDEVAKLFRENLLQLGLPLKG